MSNQSGSSDKETRSKRLLITCAAAASLLLGASAGAAAPALAQASTCPLLCTSLT